MKLTIALILFSNMMLFAAGSSGQSMKEKKISFSSKNLNLRQVFDIIEQQSSFVIGYKNNKVKTAETINYTAKNKSVYEVLQQLTKNTDLQIRQVFFLLILISSSGS